MSHGRVFLAVVLLFGWAAAASAQSGLGGLRGVVTDNAGRRAARSDASSPPRPRCSVRRPP